MVDAVPANTAIVPCSGNDNESPSVADGKSHTASYLPLPDTALVVTLKERIKHHYDLASDYYYSLWGEHIHHGYFLEANDTKERAQVQLIELLLERSQLDKGSTVLDVGCGIGGTTRYLALHHDCNVTGITISGKQVELASRLTRNQPNVGAVDVVSGSANLGNGSARFIEVDAETMCDFFSYGETFDYVWISEALSHLPDKRLFFRSAFQLLRSGGKLVIADWFRAGDLTEKQVTDDIKPIEGRITHSLTQSLFGTITDSHCEDGMLLPPLCTQSEYANFAKDVGFRVFSECFDISKHVAETW
ncbi:MAG: hypothetical protein Q9209_001074 [Squamulea sp. 1 TL-2023]